MRIPPDNLWAWQLAAVYLLFAVLFIALEVVK